jgi:hypothetical protein
LCRNASRSHSIKYNKIWGNLDLPKSEALSAGVNRAEGLHDGRHNLLKANLLFVPQVQLAPQHDNWCLQLHHTNQTRQITMGQPETINPGEHDRISGLALGDQLRRLLRAAIRGTCKINSTPGIHPSRQDLTNQRCAGGGTGEYLHYKKCLGF